MQFPKYLTSEKFKCPEMLKCFKQYAVSFRHFVKEKRLSDTSCIIKLEISELY